MNPLKEWPNLFVNGKFKIMFHEDAVNMPTRDTPFKADELGWFEGPFVSSPKATLIARPISDMTDEELAEFIYPALVDGMSDADWRSMREDLQRRVDEDGLTFSQARRFLSIGVYPFDQKAFENGTVIDTTTL